MKRKLLFLFALLVSTTMAWAQTCVWDEETKTLTVTDGNIEYNFLDKHSQYESVQHLVIGDGVVSIGEGAFNYSGIETVEFTGNDLTTIGQQSFSDIGGLTSITIPASVTTIDYYAFEHCSSLASVTFADGSLLNTINSYSFVGCSSLTSIAIPSSVTSIGVQVFNNCSSLITMTVAAGNTTYDSRNNCNAIIETASNTLIAGCKTTVIPNTVTAIGQNAIYNQGITSITIPASVKDIANYAFSNSGNLATVTFEGASLDSYGAYAFHGCSSSLVIWVPAGCASTYKNGGEGWNSYNIQEPPIASGNCGASGDNCTWKLYNDGSLVISGSGAMADYTSGNAPWYGHRADITSISIANGVTSLGNYVFEGCSSLTSVTIPSSVTSIGSGTFSGCGLTTVTIPANVTSIGNSAFASCSSLATVKVERSESPLTTLGTNVFNDCSALTSITVPYGKGNDYKAAENWHAHEAIIVEGPYTIEVTWDSATMNDLDELNSAGQSTTPGDGITLTLISNESGYTQYMPKGMEGHPKYDGVPILSSGGESDFFQFSTTLGNFTKIEIVGVIPMLSGENWSTEEEGKAVWTGNSATSSDIFGAVIVDHITFTIEPSAPASLDPLTAHLADGSYWCTYYNGSSDIEVDANTTIYTISEVNGTTATLSPVSNKVIKAGEGVILKSTASSIAIAYTETAAVAADYTGNLLAGVDEATTKAAYTAANSGANVYYTLAYEGALGFYKYTGSTLGANKAFLALDAEVGASARGFVFSFDETTSLTPVPSPKGEGSIYFNLKGQRVNKPAKGLYIKDGKKVIIK